MSDLEREFQQETRLRRTLREHEAKLAATPIEELLKPELPLKQLPQDEREHWLEKLISTDVNERVSAMWQLEGIDDPSLTGPLLLCLSDPHPEVRRLAAANLALFGDERVRRGLADAMRDASSRVRCAASTALLAQADAGALDAFLMGLGDEEWYVRYNCILALAVVGDPGAIPDLARIMLDPDDDCAETAAEALGEIGHQAGIAPLALALDHPVTAVRANAAKALGRIGGEEVISPLKRAMQDPAAVVRLLALAALETLQGETLPGNESD